MELSKGIPVRFGNVVGFVYGGPFRKYVPGTRRLVGVKMAAEINHPHEISIPTEDFSVPDVKDMQIGMQQAITALISGNDIYAGCMGGIGRTGLFMGCMAKLVRDYNRHSKGVPVPSDPVVYVRTHYMGHAIETEEQQDYVRTFDTAPLITYLDFMLAPTEVPVEVPVEVVVERLCFPPLWQYLSWWWAGGFRL